MFPVLRRKIKEDQGSVLPIFAVMILLVTVTAGAGIDFARAVNLREKLSIALDASALTLAVELSTSTMTDDEITSSLRKVFAANFFDDTYLETALANLSYTLDTDEGTVDISTKAAVPTTFIQLGGIGPETLTVSVNTEVAFSQYEVELALVLDVTGSMRSDISTLQEATESLVDTLISETATSSTSKVKISIVPYSQGVNLGSYASTVSNGNASSNCVTERLGEAQYTDDPYDYTPDDATAVSDTYFGGGSSSCPSSKMTLLPLTSDRDDLMDKIDDLAASGGTAGQTGVAWGWYTLSPNWADLWPSESAPSDYDEDGVIKFAVIMTDGDNNAYYGLETTKTCTRSGGGFGHGNSSQTCTTSTNWAGYSENEGYNNTSSTRARTLCTAMKEKGITVYGVYFGTNSSSAGALNMSACASSSSNFYLASSSSELISAFGNIAKTIQAIRLTK
ncbi:TadE/TadG family type IV pilus assembly protein [Roseibium litorale]|uniref:Pilus assembly protein n=1 Tax=Roseibium litorale TaxID=2803841 RepID=A0ABR9CIH3_9HYPH|nr:TadE/TadG family type IV pilus assembly protein [Roseibium litorale]MBD8890631.1 pilus assembly protein [Roseibium litorale]